MVWIMADPAKGLSDENLARIFDQLAKRDREDGFATGQPQGFGSEAYLNSMPQGVRRKEARKEDHIHGRSRRFMKYAGLRAKREDYDHRGGIHGKDHPGNQ